MHIIAYVYHWDRDTLFRMSFKERAMWVKMIDIQNKAEGEAIKKSAPKKK